MIFEIKRQFIHVVLGLLMVLSLYIGFFEFFGELTKLDFLGADAGGILFFLLVGLAISIGLKYTKIPFFSRLVKRFERPEAKQVFPGRGAILGLFGAFLVVVLFPWDVALASIMVLAFGDSISHVYGRCYGKIKHPFSKDKMVDGNLVGGIFGGLGAMVFVAPLPALLGALIAMFLEGVDAIKINDNVFVPVIAGLIIYLTLIL
ncbi:hypothetical protein [Methanonatronarchaeum sp. AMET-Sl]|uniref:hypothetical protein n=1 Tax=Methanonatronarchaeum sp. AMET-Sl TaxID=3037654 RepID=UPI00244DAD1A|nr:hypothetical protein [Methanonatronarchaeum sp. AMET-Sl]WGI18064.1 hypothetical protein QEN48_03425 [Methanonatronarchaeum sp. AMET-Sl]